MSKILVLGLGNTLLGDEGVGVRVVELLKEREERENVELMDGGTLSFSLAGAIADSDQLIVIDAANLQGKSGDLQVFVGEEMDYFLGSGKLSSVHEVSLLDLLSVTALSSKLPQPRALIAVQPKEIDWSDELSPAVAAALKPAAELVEQLIAKWGEV
ncbi:MAG TPA: hydrogenase maturation protease [Gammaproteobacteria bacterium]|jgi:hydrogenase maturation protease|nr:hydrogenase maturation protease [Gammaproteobacteria bacterium]